MANFAEIVDGVVSRIIVISDDDCGNAGFPESESAGQSFIASLGINGIWLQTFLDGSVRKQEAQVGFAYNADADVFIEPKPFPSWSLDSNYDWQAPVQKPDGSVYWDEELNNWVSRLND